MLCSLGTASFWLPALWSYEVQVNSDRATAAQAVLAVTQHDRTIDWFERSRTPLTPLAREISYGVLRYLPGLTREIETLLQSPLRNKDRDIMCLLLVGAYQLHFMRIPTHAVINETVTVVKKKPWAKGLINAVLRRMARQIEDQTDQSLDKPLTHLPAREQFPPWLVAQIRAQHPVQADAFLFASLQRAPMTLRINTSQVDPDVYQRVLDKAAIGYRRTPLPESLILNQPRPVDELPGFSEGLVSVQDLGAQYAAHLLFPDAASPQPWLTLDACAGPGGKLFHGIERIQQLGVKGIFHAIEVDPRRAQLTVQSKDRLGHKASITIADATTSDWWDGQRFSHILIDAPCSGTGTIRRHPDIKVLLKPEDIARHNEKQTMLLNNLWSMLQPGGTLLYCTCSILDQENDEVIERFVTNQETGRNTRPLIDSITLPMGHARRYGWQLLPTDIASLPGPIDERTDGFYFARLRRPEVAKR